MNEVFQKIVDTIVDAKGIDAATITPESSFKDLNVDSLDIAEMAMTLEDEFGITIELEEGVATVQDLVSGYNRCWGKVRSCLAESGIEGEPFLCGDGFARIGEGSGTTDCLANAGVDEAWESGVMLAKSVLKLLQEGKDFTKANLEATYVADRRASALAKRLKKASGARNGFNKSFFWGMVGEGLRGMLGIALPFKSVPPASRVPELKDAVKGRIKDKAAFEAAVAEAEKARKPLHDAVMDACGWPAIPYDGELLVLHQDALLLGGKVQAAPGFADHVTFADPELCKTCTKHTCIEVCSAQALMPSDEPGGVPKFDREKCVHCGGCIWNCARLVPGTDHGNIVFKAGSGGLHSNEN